MVRLNGWQRLGLIAVAIWIPLGFVRGAGEFIQNTERNATNQQEFCIGEAQAKFLGYRKFPIVAFPDDNANNNEAYKAAVGECKNVYTTSVEPAMWPIVGIGLLMAFIPLLVCVVMLMILLLLYRWVRAGFDWRQNR